MIASEFKLGFLRFLDVSQFARVFKHMRKLYLREMISKREKRKRVVTLVISFATWYKEYAL